METVINAIRLFLLISLGFAYLLGLGWFAVGPLLHGSLLHRKADVSLLHEIPLMLVAGLILNFTLILCIQSIMASLIVGILFTLCGAGGYIFVLSQGPAWRWPTPSVSKVVFACAFVCLLFLGPILADPLNDWDARSIWFFHAKMIYTAGSIGLSAGWQHPSVLFSHVDYPNLVPALAAQAGQVMGVWNAYLPKIALLFLLVPAIIWLFSFARRSFSFAVLLLLVPFGFSNWLWNGYMDGYLALYFAVAVLLLGRYFKSSLPADLISSVSCFCLMLAIKNEGALAALSGFGALLVIGFLRRKSLKPPKIQSRYWIYILVGIVALAPFMIWAIDKSQWNLHNNLEIGSTQSFTRIVSRLSDGSIKTILKNIFQQTEGALLLLGTVYFASAAWNKRFPKGSLPALAAASIYVIGMILVYLSTPSDLAWHINTSIDRTMLAVSGCIYVASFYILDGLEKNEMIEPA